MEEREPLNKQTIYRYTLSNHDIGRSTDKALASAKYGALFQVTEIIDDYYTCRRHYVKSRKYMIKFIDGPCAGETIVFIQHKNSQGDGYTIHSSIEAIPTTSQEGTSVITNTPAFFIRNVQTKAGTVGQVLLGDEIVHETEAFSDAEDDKGNIVKTAAGQAEAAARQALVDGVGKLFTQS